MDFEDILMAHPEIAARIRRSSRERSRKLTSIMANHLADTNLKEGLEDSQLFKELDQGVNPKIFQINVARSSGRRVLTHLHHPPPHFPTTHVSIADRHTDSEADTSYCTRRNAVELAVAGAATTTWSGKSMAYISMMSSLAFHDPQ